MFLHECTVYIIYIYICIVYTKMKIEGYASFFIQIVFDCLFLYNRFNLCLISVVGTSGCNVPRSVAGHVAPISPCDLTGSSLGSKIVDSQKIGKGSLSNICDFSNPGKSNKTRENCHAKHQKQSKTIKNNQKQSENHNTSFIKMHESQESQKSQVAKGCPFGG